MSREAITEDIELLFTVNAYQDFHWQDDTDSGYRTGVFDVSDRSFERVTQRGPTAHGLLRPGFHALTEPRAFRIRAPAGMGY